MSDDKNSEEYEVEKIICHFTVNKKTLYLIKWKNCDNNHNTWEPELNLLNCSDILKDYKSKINYQAKK